MDGNIVVGEVVDNVITAILVVQPINPIDIITEDSQIPNSHRFFLNIIYLFEWEMIIDLGNQYRQHFIIFYHSQDPI